MAATKRSKSKASNTKLFVLDTNVLMHDPTCLFRFDEHDIYLPMMTLEELDNNKKGMSEVARNARQTSRFLDELVNAAGDKIDEGIPLAMRNEFDATGHLFFQTQAITAELPMRLPVGKADNLILGVVMHLQQVHPKREVILVSKDINMRIKARAMGFAAEDYFNDRFWKTLTCYIPACMSFPRTSGSNTAKAWNRGRITAVITTVSLARNAPACWSTRWYIRMVNGHFLPR